MSVRGLRLTTLALLCISMVLLAFGVSAQAAKTHKYLSQITEVPASSGATVTGPLGFVSALTADSGELYVVDYPPAASSEARVDKFDASSGAFISQFPIASLPLEYFHQGVAVGHSSGETNVYVGGDELVSGPQGVVAVYGPTGTLKTVWKGTETPAKAFACFECNGTEGDVAVDDSPSLGWAAGDVYVSDSRNAVVDVFSPTAGSGEKYVTRLTGVGPSEPFTVLNGVAVDGANGEILVANGFAEVDMFKPAALDGQYEFVNSIVSPVWRQMPRTAISTSLKKNEESPTSLILKVLT
jgi:hypothetical protein